MRTFHKKTGLFTARLTRATLFLSGVGHEIRRAFTTVGLGIELHRKESRCIELGFEEVKHCQNRLIERCGLQHELILAQ